MARKPIPKMIETAVLVHSRRRCAICFGLDRDARLKAGQIAHLDQDSLNASEDNLAFLCLAHHDEYDSRSSQRKGFTIAEAKQFRNELYQNVNKAFTQQVHFGEIKVSPSDPYAGVYTRLGGENESAEITLTPLPDNIHGDVQYYISGLALWGVDRESGPHMGFLSGIGIMNDRKRLIYRRRNGSDYAYTECAFVGDGIMMVEGTDCFGEYGWNVNFMGTYQRSMGA